MNPVILVFIVAIVFLILIGLVAFKLQKIEKFPFFLTFCGILAIYMTYRSSQTISSFGIIDYYYIFLGLEILVIKFIVVFRKNSKIRTSKNLLPIYIITVTIILLSLSIRFYYSHFDSPIIFIAGFEPQEYSKEIRFNKNNEIISPPKIHHTRIALFLRKNNKFIVYLRGAESEENITGKYTIICDTLKLFKDRQDNFPTNWLISKDSVSSLEINSEAFYINYNRLILVTIKQ